jgi:hypothetical protein
MGAEQAESKLYSKLVCNFFIDCFFFVVLKRAFSMFDSSKTGKIEKEKVRTILNTLGHTYDDTELDDLLAAEDVEGIFKK